MQTTDQDLSPQEIAQLRRKLDAFAVGNPELEALTDRLSRFNAFRVLGIERAEIRHSNVLAWLLTPHESHGLGDRFLRLLLARLRMENPDAGVKLSAAEVERMRLDNVEVLREWRHTDIFVRSRGGDWGLLIENKIGSSVRRAQLLRYRQTVRAEMPGAEIIPVLLTLESDQPSEEGERAGYISLSHGEVLELVDRLVDQNRSGLAEEVAAFMDQYVEVLRRLALQDEELLHLCKTIYRRHRAAIDLIVQYGSSSQVLDGCEAAVKKLPDIEYWHRTGNKVWFLPKAMAEHQKEVVAGGWNFLPRRLPVMWWFFYGKKKAKLRLTMVIGPFEDPDTRLRLVRAVRDDGFKVLKKALTREAKFTRIYTAWKSIRLNEDGVPNEDEEYIAGLALDLWEKAWDKSSRIVEILENFEWD